MANGLYTTAHDWQNEYTAHLSADLGSSDTDVFLDTVPTPTEGCLVIDPDTPANTEIIFYTSKTSSKVTVPSVANGRGYDSTTATTHTSGTKVIMAPIADDFRYIRTVATTTPQGWTPLASAPNTVAANGNRSYTLTFNSTDYTSTLSAGMRLKTTRTVAAPTQCTSLNGTTQYYSRASGSVAGMTFTNNFVVSAWIKLSSYNVSNDQMIATRYNGTSGWKFAINTGGNVYLAGYNAGAANVSYIQSYQSVPLNKWVQVTAQLDMATFTSTPTTSYVMIEGVDVPAQSIRGGTNPTALVQAGNLEIGGTNGGTLPFAGKIAQVAIYSAKVTQATILASMHQTLAGTETSLISAYSFNGVITDLNANANTLTANGSAVATTLDTPFTQTMTGVTTGTLNYGIIQSVSYSTNTTAVVQVPEGDTIPTSGGVSAVSYSTQKVPYGFPSQQDKWTVEVVIGVDIAASSASSGIYNPKGVYLNAPIGAWILSMSGGLFFQASGTNMDFYYGLSTSNSSFSDPDFQRRIYLSGVSAGAIEIISVQLSKKVNISSATPYYALINAVSAGSGTPTFRGQIIANTNEITKFTAENSYL